MYIMYATYVLKLCIGITIPKKLPSEKYAYRLTKEYIFVVVEKFIGIHTSLQPNILQLCCF